MSYQRLLAPARSELVVRKSRFIASIDTVTSRAEVGPLVERMREHYPEARHHCWAYLLGRPQDARSAGMNDDGEPSGTAGKPILNVLQHGDIGDALIVVSRYFGGIKLGAGGLVRAYSAAAQQVLDIAPAQTPVASSDWEVGGDFAAEQLLRHFLTGCGGEVLEVIYSQQLIVRLRVPDSVASQLASLCAAQGFSLAELKDY